MRSYTFIWISHHFTKVTNYNESVFQKPKTTEKKTTSVIWTEIAFIPVTRKQKPFQAPKVQTICQTEVVIIEIGNKPRVLIWTKGILNTYFSCQEMIYLFLKD